MATLLFFDDSHTYTVDGEPVPSVSELCRFVSREVYKDVAQFRLDNAAERGTSVHKATEILDKYGKCEVTEDIEPYLRAYLAFRKEHECQWQKIEFATHHPDRLYAGTLDRYGLVDGVPAIVDIKSCATVDPAHRTLYTAQLNLYRRMLPESMPVEKLYILHLKKDAAYKLWELPVEDSLADACLTLHAALKKKKRKKKEQENNG